MAKNLRLTPDNIYDYFTKATALDSSTIVGKKLFDFIDRGSKILVVTIGDSWTWGADLTQLKEHQTHCVKFCDDNYRLSNMYGNVFAKKIGADFLSLGQSGAGNWYIDKKIKELYKIAHCLPYEKIYVLSVFTDNGRDFNCSYDSDVDYRSWLLDNIKHAQNYYEFLSFVNSQISKSILKTITSFDARYNFMFSCNFVDPIGYELLKPWFTEKTWLQIICETANLQYLPKKCYVVFPWVIEKFEAVLHMAPELNRLDWLTWADEITHNANIRASVCSRDNFNFGPLLHPLAHNHACWANYLSCKL